MRIPFLLCLSLLLLPGAGAVERIPGTTTSYSVSRDPITDVNTGFVVLPEINDTTGQTRFILRCANYDRQELWAWMSSKFELSSQDDADSGIKPAVTIRLGDDPPTVLSDSDLSVVLNGDETVDRSAIGFNGAVVRRIVNGLNAGKRLVVRVNRPSGGQALTYTFPASGVSTAWAKVNGCAPQRPGAGSATPNPVTVTPAPGAQAPKFTRWYFTTCRDASSGVTRTGLTAGRAHLCDLVIDTVPNGARPVRAEFRYELEYRDAARSGKLTLDATDVWPPAGGTNTALRQSGSQLIFTLPLNVRARADRVYTSLNVTATVYFSNGTSKRVYEPLPVRP